MKNYAHKHTKLYLNLKNFSSFNLCEFIGQNLCDYFAKPGVHTIEDMEEKLGFNRTLLLPEPPSLLGISFLDLFSVNLKIK